MKFISIIGAALFIAGTLSAQVPQVRISQYAEVKQTMGLTSVSIVYHRPGVKGRVIWGDLLKYGEIWRAGANEPTLVTFSTGGTISGQKFNAGTYRLVVVPAQTGPWTVILNSEVKNWGTVYDSTYDVLKLPVTPAAAPHEEWMSFSFDEISAAGGTLVLRWEKIALRMPLMFDTETAFAAATASAESNTWRVANNYARYVLENGGDMKKAMAAADKAVSMNEGPATLRTKAELQVKMGDTSGGIATIERALSMAKAQKANTTVYENLLKDWQKK